MPYGLECNVCISCLRDKCSHMISLVYAISNNGVIGKNGGLPWHMPSDLKHFKAVTLGKPVIMGRKTWESLPRKPLPGRQNIVVSRQLGFVAGGATVVANIADAVARAGAAAASTDRAQGTQVATNCTSRTFDRTACRRGCARRWTACPRTESECDPAAYSAARFAERSAKARQATRLRRRLQSKKRR